MPFFGGVVKKLFLFLQLCKLFKRVRCNVIPMNVTDDQDRPIKLTA